LSAVLSDSPNHKLLIKLIGKGFGLCIVKL